MKYRYGWLALGASAALAAASGCGGDSSGSGGQGGAGQPKEASGTTVSASLALTKDDATLWVVNQDSDSVSVIDTATRKLVAEIPLGKSAPAVDPATKRFDPLVSPRSLAIVDGAKVYVAGETSGLVYVIDAKTHAITASIPVAAAPVSVAAASDGSAVYVVSHEAGMVTKIDPRTDTVLGSVFVSEHPWGVTVSGDNKTLFVTHLLLGPGVTAVDAATLDVRKTAIAEEMPGSDKRIPNGVPRGLYGVTLRPGTGEIWAPHMLLAIKTPQPQLDFESTVFPTISTLNADGSKEGRRILFQPLAVPGAQGSFIDSVSGPRQVAFTPDGKLALLLLSQSEDVMVFNAETGNEVSLVRPIPSALPEGIVIDHAGKYAYVEGRNTHDVTVLAIDQANAIAPVKVDGAPIDRITADPMPADLRHGQRIFYTANTAAYPVTKNFWVSCASCHLEGGTDAVTWLFSAGPRDTPSNAGGPGNTGFLLRQALRANVNQYDETIRVEQGGTYDINQATQKPDLDALAAYVDRGIPFPVNPNLAPDGKLTAAQARGQGTFQTLCATCHTGPFLTDSASGNPMLDLSQSVVLHDIGTCVKKGPYPDKVSKDVLGDARTACDFDTPTLRGIFATAPYFHDGSALTLRDVVDRLSFSSGLPSSDKADLVAYLLTL